MPTLILLDVPSGFPCWAAAMTALPAARERGMDRIRVSKGGHTCELAVTDLERELERSERGLAPQPPKSLMWTATQHEAVGNVLEMRRPVWPGFSG